jgi:hypothetical protein
MKQKMVIDEGETRGREIMQRRERIHASHTTVSSASSGTGVWFDRMGVEFNAKEKLTPTQTHKKKKHNRKKKKKIHRARTILM